MDTRTLKGATHWERMADFHRRMAETFRREAARPETSKKWRTKILRDVEAAERLAAECDAKVR